MSLLCNILCDCCQCSVGLMMCMAVDPFQNWVALGTSLGYHVIWDMRFQLPIRYWQHEGHGKRELFKLFCQVKYTSQFTS